MERTERPNSGLNDAHCVLRAPSPDQVRPAPRGLLPEEQWYYAHFVQTYCELFSDKPAVCIPHGSQSVTRLPRRGVELGGAVDLLLEDRQGRLHLRQLELWGRDLSADPYSSWEMTLAALRLRQTGVVRGPLHLVQADLSNGFVVESDVDLSDDDDSDLPHLASRFDERYRSIRSRTSTAIPERGASCGVCSHIEGCDAWAHKPRLPPRSPDRQPYMGRVVPLTPTSVETWASCPRWYRARHVLNLPGWPMGPKGRMGLLVHERLALLHSAGACSMASDRRTEAAMIDGQLSHELLGYLNRHASRCPTKGVSIGHELPLAELLGRGSKATMISARVDAVWIYNGMLDCRDYKTGPVRNARVQDDIGGRLQALALAPLADRLGLRLRLRFEHLGEGTVEDPEPFEPDSDDLETLQVEFADLAQTIDRSDFGGVADPLVCIRCPFHFACPDSAAGEDIAFQAVDYVESQPDDW